MSLLADRFFHWINQSRLRAISYSFVVQELHANPSVKSEAERLLGKAIATSYRGPNDLRRTFSEKAEADLYAYLEKNVFPVDRNGQPHDASQRMLKSGDFGEVVAECLAKASGVEVPLTKLLWKLNKDKAMFCTDLFCHDPGLSQKQLQYWEVKTRLNLSRTRVKERADSFYVPAVAHDSLKRDKEQASDQIADFLCRQYLREAEVLDSVGKSLAANARRQLADKYQDIVLGDGAYTRAYVVCLLLDSPSAFDEKILDELHKLPSEIDNLTVKLILVEELGEIITNSYKEAYAYLRNYVYESTDGQVPVHQ